ncbi:MAG TPA: metallophosphoesterase [Vicinamibacterales bacterium]|nr:metallophosphoesterase [Vicinamibacterales bacterium]
MTRIVHFGDLHLRDRAELSLFERQLARAADERPDHIVISGDLVDRWNGRLLRGARRALASDGLLDAARLTIIHGNHDLASSGGWPRTRADIPRMVLRFWDPPPLLAWRRARFARLFAPASEPLPFERQLGGGLRLLAIDSTPLPFLPFVAQGRRLRLLTALGRLRERDLRWLASRAAAPSVLVIHHCPVLTPPLQWNGGRVIVPMHVEGSLDRFWSGAERAGVRLVLCGHIHHTRIFRQGAIAVAAQGQSGADWAGRPFSVHEVGEDGSLLRSQAIPQNGDSPR